MSLYMNIPGYRFYPTEEELLAFYLRHKLENRRPLEIERFIPVLDVYNYHPSDLKSMAGEANRSDTEQWFFLCPRQEKEAQGGRPTRTTLSGYWKATGSPNYIFSSGNKIIGVKRTMVFYQGRAPTGTKTEWKMNEYKLLQHDNILAGQSPLLRQEFSLCRVYIRTSTLRSFDRRPLNTTNNTSAANLNSSFLHERTDSNGNLSPGGDFDAHLNPEETVLDWNLLSDFDLDLNWF